MTTKTFQLTEDRFDHKAGTLVYEWIGHDYGLARDDAMVTGEMHTSVSLVRGKNPFFTVPSKHLRVIE